MGRTALRCPRGLSILGRIAWRSLAENPARTALSLVGIFLSSMLVTAVMTTVTSFDRNLFERTAETEGGWYCWSGAASDAAVASLCDDERVSAVAVSHELGATLLDGEAGQAAGAFALAVVEVPNGLKGSREQTDALVRVPDLAEGRMPAAPDEIVLSSSLRGVTLAAGRPVGAKYLHQGRAWSRWGVAGGARGTSGASSDGPLELGSTITLAMGTLHLGDGRATNATDTRPSAGVWEADECVRELREPVVRTYRVVGFRLGLQDYQEASLVDAERGYTIGLTCAGAADDLSCRPTSQSVWACCDGYRSSRTFEEALHAHFRDRRALGAESCEMVQAGCQIHWSLVHYAGLFERRGEAGGIWTVAWLLVAVTAVTAVSLIYTSLAITVRERTRQYGLLASQGATARQIRHMVMTEALMLGIVAIPLGMCAGIAGVAATLGVTGDAFAYVLDGARGPDLYVSLPVLLRVTAMLVLALLLSAWLPMRRAGATAPVDAVRQAGDACIGRRARCEIGRRRRRKTVATSVGQLPSLFARLAGVSGFIAHRNLSRRHSRGLVLSLSLAISFSLFVTSGVVSGYLRAYDDAASTQGHVGEGDVLVGLGLNPLPGDASASAVLERQVDEAVRTASALDGVRVERIERVWQMQVRIPGAMISPELRQSMDRRDAELAEEGVGALELNAAHFTDEGDYVGPAEVHVVDDKTWATLARAAGSDPARDDSILAVNLYRTFVFNDRFETYVRESLAPYRSLGTVEVYGLSDEHASSNLVVSEGQTLAWRPSSDSGSWEDGGAHDLCALDEALESTCRLTVDGMVGPQVELGGLYDSVEVFPLFVMPQRFFSGHDVGCASGAYVVLGTNDPHLALSQIERHLLLDHPDVYEYAYSPSTEVRQAHALTRAIRLFATMFSLITALISVANAFNTLSNGMDLRAHEFAVLRSVGMSPRAFRKMIVCECVSYAINGLVLGMALVLVVDVVLWHGFAMMFEGARLVVPWLHMVTATLGVVLVLALGVAYALRKTRGTSIVEALRAEVA